jgi:hypothetical protein
VVLFLICLKESLLISKNKFLNPSPNPKIYDINTLPNSLVIDHYTSNSKDNLITRPQPMTPAPTALGLINDGGFTPDNIPPYHIYRIFYEHITWLESCCRSADDAGRPSFIEVTKQIEPASDLQRVTFELLQVDGLLRFIEGYFSNSLTLFASNDEQAYAYPSFSVDVGRESAKYIKITLRKIVN